MRPHPAVSRGHRAPRAPNRRAAYALAVSAWLLTSSADCPCLRQDRLRLAQLHLLERLALLLLRPTDQELSNAQRFVAFFLFGTRFPDEPPRANCAG